MLVCAVFFINACTRHSPPPKIDNAGNKSIAVMPFIKGRKPGNISQILSCPYEGFCYEDGELQTNANRIMTEMLQGKLMAKLEERVVPLNKVKRVYARLEYPKATPLEIAEKLGTNIGVDYVMVGNIWRYRERIGSSLGVDKPASVAFALYLVNVETGKAVWHASFNETQQSLSENLLKAPSFFKCGAKWLIARELARCGMDEALKEFPLR